MGRRSQNDSEKPSGVWRRDGLGVRYVRLRDEDPPFRGIDYDYQDWDDYWGYDDEDIDREDLTLVGRYTPLVRHVLQPNLALDGLRRLLPDALPVLAPAPDAAALILRLDNHLRRIDAHPDDPELAAEIRRAIGSAAAREAVRRALPLSADVLLLFAPFWLRSPETWTLDAEETLLEHLFVRYPVPPFLLTALADPIRLPSSKWLCWLILMGGGASLPAAARPFGWDIPGKFAHYLFHAPTTLDGPTHACLFAEVLRLGGDANDYQRITQDASFVLDPTDMDVPDDEIDFWRQTAQWLIRHRDALDDTDARRILAWARHSRTEGGFRWNGRGVAAARERAEAYEFHITRYRYQLDLRWQPRGWDWRSPGGWSATELTTTRQLIDEGVAMRHCVGGYGWRCYNGYSAIFSVRNHDDRRVTIEVNPVTRALVQVYGYQNRLPTDEEAALVARWHETVVLAAP